MPKTKISEYSTTNADNTDIESINIAEGCAPSGINNAIRELMVHLKEFQTGSSGDPLTVAGTFVASGGATLSGTNTFSGSTVMAASAGTSASPSIYFSGDTNTGVFSPAADEVAVAAGGSVAAAFNSHQFMGMRNRIINGDMRIDQRNNGAAVTASDARPVDRFRIQNGSDGAYSAQQDSSAPAGFVNSLKFTTTTADASLAAGQYVMCTQAIEGTNISDLAWGTANAKTITLSFWVRSSLTGTFGGALENSASNRSYPFTYSISAANTWEQKSVTIAGDTTGTWLTTTGVGIYVRFGLGVGSTFSGTANTWAAADYFSATGATSVIGTLNATWYITGVQLEVGSVATPFERRPYGTELALCQRYYYKVQPEASGNDYAVGSNASTTESRVMVFFPVPMRAAPTALEQSGTAGDYTVRHAATFTACSSVPVFFSATKNNASTQLTVASGLTAGQGSFLRPANTSSYLAWSAEL